MFSVRLPVNSRQLVVKCWGSQKLCGFSTTWEVNTLSPHVVQGSTLYTYHINVLNIHLPIQSHLSSLRPTYYQVMIKNKLREFSIGRKITAPSKLPANIKLAFPLKLLSQISSVNAWMYLHKRSISNTAE